MLAIYFLVFAESGWLRILGGLYAGLFFVVSIVAACQSTEPLLHLIFPGLIVLLMVFACSIRAKWKDWP